MNTVSIQSIARLVAAAVLAMATLHPVAAQQTQPAQPLPEGHPPIGAMPEGHPPMSGMGGPGGMSLPEGHPPMGGTGAEAHLQMTPLVASIVVQAVQGTPGGAMVTGDDVVLELHTGQGEPTILTAAIDEHGVVTFENLALPGPAQPVARVQHAGVDYETVGEVLDAAQPRQKLVVDVYEVGDSIPDHYLRMRHVMVRTSPHGLHVSEVVVVDHPGTHTWLGKVTEDGGRETLALQLPPNLERVQLQGGFHECCTQLDHGRLTSSMPLKPGSEQYRYSYMVPIVDGKATLTFSAELPTQRVTVFIPDDGTTVTASGVSDAGSMTMGRSSSRLYKAEEVPAGQAITLTIEGIEAANIDLPAMESGASGRGAMPGSGPGSVGGPGASTAAPKVVAAIGGGAIVLVALVLILAKGAKRSSTAGHRGKGDQAAGGSRA